MAQHLARPGFVEADQLANRSDRRSVAELLEVAVQVTLELVEHDVRAEVGHLAGRGDVRGIDEGCADTGEGTEGDVDHGRLGGAQAFEEDRARHSDPDALEPSGRQRLRVVAARVAAARARGAIGGIDARHRAQEDGGVGHGPAERPGGVLAGRDRNDAGSRDQTESRLHADD